MGKSLKGKELGKGISQRKDGLYQARYVNRFGKRETIYAKTYGEITKKLRDSQYCDEKELNVADSKMTLDEWFAVWVSTCKKHCRNTTINQYNLIYNRLREELGWRKLETLNLVVIQTAINHLKTDASRRACKRVLVDMLNCAVKSDLINRNVACNVNAKVDGTKQGEKRILTNDEIEIFCSATKGRDGSLYSFFVIAINTGMRVGEILGLTWDCIDLDCGIIKVEKTLCIRHDRGNNICEFHPPKTSASKRSIPMTTAAFDAFILQKERCERLNAKIDPIHGFENLVFTNRLNHPTDPASIRIEIGHAVERINKQYPELHFEPFTPHCLRHTFATNCIAKGMNPKVLQKILGHSTLQMTMDLYCHVLDDTMRDEMSLIGQMV